MIDQLMTFDPQVSMKLGELFKFLGVVVLCAGVLYLVYRHISSDETDGIEFATTIFMLTIAIGLLVSIIKQAPAISFGLFGAMSIVRFRAQIKRPQRMIFIFMAAAIGVCCGAGEYVTTLFGTAVLSILSLASFSLVRAAEAKNPNFKKGKIKPVPAVTAGNLMPAALLAPQLAPGTRWGMDFVPAMFDDGKKARVLIIADENTHEMIAAVAETNFTGARVAGELKRLASERGTPSAIVSETWPEFGSRDVKDWKKAAAVDWQYLEEPAPEAAEPFMTTVAQIMHDDCFKGQGLANIVEARIVLEKWRETYNQRLGAARAWRPAEAAQVTGPAVDGHEPATSVVKIVPKDTALGDSAMLPAYEKSQRLVVAGK